MKDPNASFMWEQHPKAEELAMSLLDKAKAKNSLLQELESDMHALTSTRLFDWVDHISAQDSPDLKQSLLDCGYEEEGRFSRLVSYRHFGAQLPTIVLGSEEGVAVTVDHISDFLMVRGLNRSIHGSLLSPYRRCLVHEEKGSRFWVVERRGTRTMETSSPSPDYLADYLTAKELWKTRPRESLDIPKEMEEAHKIAADMVAMIGRDLAASIVCEVERDYWQARNTAGHVQKGRQDRLGLGWSNHDHHTFRSSREGFMPLVQLFETLGFSCRERFYAGEDAGWGAQVMENGNAGLVLFLDVDLSPEEVAIDFTMGELPKEKELGTIGLWCALHGDSILKGGMHHLELQFNFDDLQKDLDQLGVGMMAPFSHFDYLKQAFTKGEVWRVDDFRIQSLLDEGTISSEQAESFRKNGAVGSHMENLQRRAGYKGFNQKNVSNIIKRTDPRNLSTHTP